jgi:hypothetical protein
MVAIKSIHQSWTTNEKGRIKIMTDWAIHDPESENNKSYSDSPLQNTRPQAGKVLGSSGQIYPWLSIGSDDE